MDIQMNVLDEKGKPDKIAVDVAVEAEEPDNEENLKCLLVGI
jgi:hypothetical protein